MHSLRPQTARIEVIFEDGDTNHPLTTLLAHLDSTRTVGVDGYLYGHPRPKAVKRSYAHDRDIIRAIESLGCFWPDAHSPAHSPAQWTELGNVDVVFLDAKGQVLGATITHERMIVKLPPAR